MTSYKIVPLTNLNKYLHYDISETEVDLNISVNNGTEKLWEKKTIATSVKLIVTNSICIVLSWLGSPGEIGGG
jgi:hypothetical protein